MSNPTETQVTNLNDSLDANPYILGSKDGKFTHENLYNGMVGEKVTNSAMRKAFPDWTVKHNPFGNQYRYACAHGVDLTLTKDGYLPIYGEVKNLKQQSKPYGTDFVNRHVIPRFEGLYGLKILFITFLSLLTRDAQYLLKRKGIIPFEVGERLTTQFFTEYPKLIKLAQLIKSTIKPTPRFVQSSYPALTNYLLPLLSPQPLAVANQANEELNKQHDTVKEDKELSTVVKPRIVINHPCQIGHPDHEAWLDRQITRAERMSS